MIESVIMENLNQSVYIIENVFCGTETANEVYKEAIKDILIKD